MPEIRLTFRSEIYIHGKDIEEIRRKWQEIPLFSVEALDAGAEVLELIDIEDAKTHKGLAAEWCDLE